MKYLSQIRDARDAPQQLELLFQTALKANEAAEFKRDLLACYEAAPDNVLYAAWYYRFEHAASEAQPEQRRVNWKLAVPLSLLTGLILWLLSDETLAFKPNNMPYLALLAAPIIAAIALLFMVLTIKDNYRRTAVIIACLAGITVYVFWLSGQNEHYRNLSAAHLPLLSWAAIGAAAMSLYTSPRNKFAFLIKSIEVIVTGGVYLIAIYIFAAITLEMFSALNIRIPDMVNRLMFVGGGGLIPLIAMASAYDPQLPPIEQEFRSGVGRLIITFPRILLGLSIPVLVIYIGLIPFNFRAPFDNRDVLIVYNIMLFGVVGLLVGATPVNEGDISPRYQTALRLGILLVAGLVVAISAYALTAIVYRTIESGLTINRLAVIGWNGINIGLLILLIERQIRQGKSVWIESLHSVFNTGIGLYLLWTVFLLLAVPWLF
jgi:hypothetical protein